MNSVNLPNVNTYIKILFLGFYFMMILNFPANAWEIDFSRRQLEFQSVKEKNRQTVDRSPASLGPAVEGNKKEETPLTQILESTGASQDIVIMNTDEGFIPATLSLRKGKSYKIHVVNIHSKEKNISFILDAFSEQHNTVFGQQKTFLISPQATGTFSYQCPETSKQGKLVILGDERTPAGE